MKDILSAIFQKRNHHGVIRYTRNLGWMFIARITTMAIGFLATTYIARNLGPENYGELSYAISFVAIFGAVASLGIDQVLSRELLFFPEKHGAVMGTALILRLCSGAILFLATSVFAFFASPHDVSLIAIFIISSTLVSQTFSLIGQEFLSSVQLKWPSIQSIIVVFILNIAKILVIFFHGGVLYLAAVIALEPILYAIGYTIIRIRYFGGINTLSYNQAIAWTLLRDAVPLIFVSGFYMIYARIDQVFIKHMMNAKSVGLYDAAVRLSEVWYFIPLIVIAGLSPAIANAKRSDNQLYLARTQKLFFFLLASTSTLALGTTLLARPIVTVVFGASFAGADSVLAIYIWSNIGSALTYITQQLLIIEHMTRYILIGSFLGMTTNILLCVLLIPSYGIIGAALASAVAYIIPFLALFCFPKTRSLIISILKYKHAT